MGLCSLGPIVRGAAADVIYTEVRPEEASALVGGDQKQFGGRMIRPDHAFFAGQTRIILANSGRADPERIVDYIAWGGYQSLLRVATEMTPQEITAEVKKSGLRGRGGAGYPTGLKWELVARNPSAVKYVVCNADEGDPGAYMNRSVLEGDPHRVLGGNGDCRPRGRRGARLYLRARRVSLSDCAGKNRHRASPTGRICWVDASSTAISISGWIFESERAPTFAERDCADRLHRRQKRTACTQTTLPAGKRTMGTPDLDQ